MDEWMDQYCREELTILVFYGLQNIKHWPLFWHGIKVIFRDLAGAVLGPESLSPLLDLVFQS